MLSAIDRPPFRALSMASDRPCSRVFPHLNEALRNLPQRLLFQNEFLRILLIGVDRATPLAFRITRPVLISVTFGCIRVRTRSVTTELFEGDHLRLEPGESYELATDSTADLVANVVCR